MINQHLREIKGMINQHLREIKGMINQPLREIKGMINQPLREITLSYQHDDGFQHLISHVDQLRRSIEGKLKADELRHFLVQ